MKKTKKIMAALLAMAMTASVSFTAVAADARTPITKIDITDIYHNIDIDEIDADVDVSFDSNPSGTVDLDYAYCTNIPSDAWDDGDKPRVKIILRVDSDYDETYKFYNTKVTLDSKEGTVDSVSYGDSGRNLTITVTLPKLERDDPDFYDYALMVDNIEFDDASGVATWDENEYADRYEVRIYRNDGYLAGSFKTDSLEYDLSKYFTRKGDYTCKVRGIRYYAGSGPDFEGEWSESNTVTVDSEEAEAIRTSGGSNSSSGSTGVSTGSFTADKTDIHNYASGPAGTILGHEGTWVKNPIGWWWSNPDGSYPTNTWKEIGDGWYYFDNQGYVVEDTWVHNEYNSNWYYCDGGGKMITNTWVKTNEVWYYCGPDGAMVRNTWVKSSDVWYYCGQDGAMWRDTTTPDGYYVNANGVWE